MMHWRQPTMLSHSGRGKFIDTGTPIRLPRVRSRLLAVLCLVFIFWQSVQQPLHGSVNSQETPYVSVNKFDRSAHRTNLCQRQLMLYNGTMELPNALSGLQLSVAITNYQTGKETYFFSLTKDDRIDELNPGLFAILLDELASRAGFEWRNSFATYLPLDPMTDGNKTWTDILTWAVTTFDISMERWAHTLERLAIPVSFPLSWYDNSVVLGEIVQSSQSKRVVDLWSFLDPFHLTLWLGATLAVAVTGIVYWILEIWNVDADERQLECKPLASIFYAAITFTGHYELRPQTHPARLVGFSFTFWALIVGSSYTANLAGFLVSPRVAVFKAATIQDVLKTKAYVCVQEGGAISKILKTKYPSITLVPKSPEQAIFDGLRQPRSSGGCDAVAHQLNTYEVYEHLREVNFDCAMRSEKRVVEVIPAGLATAVDTGAPYCTSLISHVLDYHLTAMMDDGFLDRMWKQHLDRISTIDCAKESSTGGTTLSEDDTFSLTIQDVGGIFIVHVVLSSLAVLIAVYQFYRTRNSGTLNDERTLSTVFGITQVKEEFERRSSSLKMLSSANATTEFNLPAVSRTHPSAESATNQGNAQDDLFLSEEVTA
jgi:Ligand-gated ion channel